MTLLRAKGSRTLAFPHPHTAAPGDQTWTTLWVRNQNLVDTADPVVASAYAYDMANSLGWFAVASVAPVPAEERTQVVWVATEAERLALAGLAEATTVLVGNEATGEVETAWIVDDNLAMRPLGTQPSDRVDLDARVAAVSYDLGDSGDANGPVVLNVCNADQGIEILGGGLLTGDTDTSLWETGDHVLAYPSKTIADLYITTIQPDGGSVDWVIAGQILRRDVGNDNDGFYNVTAGETAWNEGTSPVGVQFKNDNNTTFTDMASAYDDDIAYAITREEYGNAVVKAGPLGLEVPVVFDQWSGNDVGYSVRQLQNVDVAQTGWHLANLRHPTPELIATVSIDCYTEPIGTDTLTNLGASAGVTLPREMEWTPTQDIDALSIDFDVSDGATPSPLGGLLTLDITGGTTPYSSTIDAPAFGSAGTFKFDGLLFREGVTYTINLSSTAPGQSISGSSDVGEVTFTDPALSAVFCK